MDEAYSGIGDWHIPNAGGASLLQRTQLFLWTVNILGLLAIFTRGSISHVQKKTP